MKRTDSFSLVIASFVIAFVIIVANACTSQVVPVAPTQVPQPTPVAEVYVPDSCIDYMNALNDALGAASHAYNTKSKTDLTAANAAIDKAVSLKAACLSDGNLVDTTTPEGAQG